MDTTHHALTFYLFMIYVPTRAPLAMHLTRESTQQALVSNNTKRREIDTLRTDRRTSLVEQCVRRATFSPLQCVLYVIGMERPAYCALDGISE